MGSNQHRPFPPGHQIPIPNSNPDPLHSTSDLPKLPPVTKRSTPISENLCLRSPLRLISHIPCSHAPDPTSPPPPRDQGWGSRLHDDPSTGAKYTSNRKPSVDLEYEMGLMEDKEGGVNKETGEIGGLRGPKPTRYGDLEQKGCCFDF
ncbi:hypothetical protein LINGRAHAP2_LOCUS30216 [Linum grandiflorum]